MDSIQNINSLKHTQTWFVNNDTILQTLLTFLMLLLPVKEISSMDFPQHGEVYYETGEAFHIFL
jgi:hypothetical protein